MAEVYFQGDEAITFPLSLMREQAESARILLEEFDAWLVSIPSLEDLVKASSGKELEELLIQLEPVDQWRIRSIRQFITQPKENPDPEKRTPEQIRKTTDEWMKLYRQGEKAAAADVITRILDEERGRTDQARLYNNRGYIRYDIKDQIELAKRDLQRAIDLHHQFLPLTLLNLAVVAIDAADFGIAIEHINEALLITLGRESILASYLRLRLLPGHLLMTRHEKWEEAPANLLEVAYVNLGYAVAHAEGYEAALEALEEGRELMPSSPRLVHALARLHLWNRKAAFADPLYRQLAEMEIPDRQLRLEAESYLKIMKGGRRKK